jgi:hypothetical protein
MSAATKLVAFGFGLALLFGAAALAGGAVKPLRSQLPSQANEGMAMEADVLRGLAVSDGGLTLDLSRRSATPGAPFHFAFRILDADGRAVSDFDIEHTKRLHLIVVRRDMTDFQHLHPAMTAAGTWSVPLTLHEPGSYRVFADFSFHGTPYTLADDLQANGTVTWRTLPAPAKSAQTDGFRVQLIEGHVRTDAESELRFTVTGDGQRVRLQDYLGAKGHLVALRQGDLAYLHVHPDTNTLKFMAGFPSAGRYRLFLQFKVDGHVHTAAFTQEVFR